MTNAFPLALLLLGAAPAPAPTAPPATLREPATGMVLVLVRGGCFAMGDVFGDGEEEEGPVHEVCLGDFWLGRTEVTQGEWKAVMGSNPSRDPGCTDDRCPVDGVSWEDAQAFVARLDARSGGKGKYRLPTEAEWEYAARSGGRRERYAGGDDVDRVAWYSENSGRRNHPVATKAPNGLGLHDMSGNVWEWVADWYADDAYARSARRNPSGPAAPAGANVDHVLRGGCKTGEASNARTARRTYGYHRTSGVPSDKVGFRIARTADAPDPRYPPADPAPRSGGRP